MMTLQTDAWMKDAPNGAADELFSIVVGLLHGALDVPVTYRGLLTLHTQLAPHVLTSAFASQLSDDERADCKSVIDAYIKEAERQLESEETPAPQSHADKARLEQGVLKFHSTLELFKSQGGQITYAQLLELEYGVVLRPLFLYWTL